MLIHLSHLYSWKDVVEILTLATVLYQITRWLALDKQKNLVIPFSLYCGAIIVTSLTQCLTLYMLLVTYAPVAFVILLLVHQTQLQKNFVTLSRLEPVQEAAKKSDWLDAFLRACVISFNKQKNLNVIIESTDYLSEFMELEYRIDTKIDGGILELLVDSSLFKDSKYIWIDTRGLVRGINAQLSPTMLTNLGLHQEQSHRKHEGQLITSITDAVVIKTHATSREFDVIVQGKEYPGLSTNAALALLKKYFLAKREDHSGVSYAASYQKTTDHTSAS